MDIKDHIANSLKSLVASMAESDPVQKQAFRDTAKQHMNSFLTAKSKELLDEPKPVAVTPVEPKQD